MKLSVLIPSFNRLHSLSVAVESVLAQSHFEKEGWVLNRDYELIVVDDGSDDGTAEYVGRVYPDVQLLVQNNRGVSAARNAGLGVAQGEWIALLDSDDSWMPEKLSVQFDAIDETGLAVCHTQEIWIRKGVRVNQHNKHQKHGGMIYAHCLPLCAMSPSSILIHRDVFSKVGGFDEGLPACEDYDLWLRICSYYQVAFVGSPQIYKTGGHADQLSRQHWGMDRFRVTALEKILIQADFDSKPKPKPKPDWLLNQELIAQTRSTLLEKAKILRNGAIKHANQQLAEEMTRKIERWNR